jgi:hypothetical protein
MPRADKIHYRGTFESRDEAASSLSASGDAALVKRGVLRMLLIKCPCGCGDLLVINLDSRSGPAWRVYKRGSSFSLYPSYWRDSFCKSHFVLWKNQVHWCDWDDESLWQSPSQIEELILRELPEKFVSYEALADKLQQIPWDVLQACYSLVRKGYAEQNYNSRKGEFRRSTFSNTI